MKNEKVFNDPPSKLNRMRWRLMGRCIRCGNEFEEVMIRGRHKKMHYVKSCVHCGHKKRA